MNPFRLTRLGTIGVVAAMLAATGAPAQAQARAQQAAPRARAEVRAIGQPVTESVVTTMQTTDEGRQILIKLRNGEVVTATIDGKDVARDRIAIEDGTVRVLGADGEVLFEMAQPPAPPATPSAPRVYQLDSREGMGAMRWASGAEGGPEQFAWRVVEGQPAKPAPVMLGVSLAEPDRSMRKHFGLEPGEAIMLLSVYDGLPAAEAGLREFDLILAVRGEPASPDDLRARLRDAEPGDTLPVTVIQRGQRKDVTIKLRAYDREELDAAAARHREQMAASGEDVGFFDFNVIAPAPPAPPAPPALRAPSAPGARGQPSREALRELEVHGREQAAASRQHARELLRLQELHAARRGDAERQAAEVQGRRQQQSTEELEARLDRMERLLERLAEELEAKREGGGN